MFCFGWSAFIGSEQELCVKGSENQEAVMALRSHPRGTAKHQGGGPVFFASAVVRQNRKEGRTGSRGRNDSRLTPCVTSSSMKWVGPILAISRQIRLAALGVCA